MGFSTNSYLAYNLRENDYTQYLSSRRSARNKYINGKRGIVLSDKLVFERLMQDIIKIPQNYSWISDGILIALEKKYNLVSVPRVIEHCKCNNAKLVFKPLTGSGGQGVKVLKVQEGSIMINQDEIDSKKLSNLISGLDDYIVTEFVEQGSYISEIFSGSVNTVRILTLVDPTTNEPFIARAVHRIGTNRSAPTDNMSRGALFAPIQLETGVLGSAAQYPKFSNSQDRVIWYDDHPDTGKTISGVQIPKWSEVRETILKAAREIRYIPYIGWDVCIREEDIVVLEGNSGPGLVLFQMVEPLLCDPKIAKFYKHYGIV